MRTFSINRTGDALGDHMMAAFFVQLLNDNGLPAVYGSPCYRDLVDVPLSLSEQQYDEFYFLFHQGSLNCPTFDKNKTVLEVVLERFREKFGISRPLTVFTRHVPVKYEEIEEIRGYDVAMATRSGVWSRVRDWPYFEQLKQLLDERSITYIDLTTSNVVNNACLNFVAKSRLYLGLDTGVSHYVSQVAKKGLILQSGYSDFRFWCQYDYECIEHKLPCSPCFIHCKTKPYFCPHDHRCMKEISPELVVQRIMRLLE